jgi:hypothetical protein
MALIKLNNQSISAVDVGKVLQVVNSTHSSTALTNGTSYVDSGLSVSITPSSASSKIYVIYSSGMETNGTTAHKGICAIFRDSTNINELSFKQQANSEAGSPHHPICSQVLDSPNTTSSVTYKMKFKSNSSGVYVVAQIDSHEGSISVMEIEN